MSEEAHLIEAVKEGDTDRAEKLLDQGADIHQRDEHGWTPLNWAAGKNDISMVKLLLDRGADVSTTGRDNRTPLMIAKAADCSEVVELLTAAEKEKGVWLDPQEARPYCKAHHLRDLRRFAGWKEAGPMVGAGAADGEDEDLEPLDDDSIVYIHHDFTVTRSMWRGEQVVYDEVTPEWRRFCEQELEFAIPGDLL